MLIRPGEGGKEPYDRFRGRLMIPIRDPRGRVIGFGGRILALGSPNISIRPTRRSSTKAALSTYRPRRPGQPHRQPPDRGRRLYGRHRPRPRRHRRGRGAQWHAVTEAQLERMWRLDPAPILCFDGDNAGKKAAIRAALRALPHLRPDRTLRFVELPAGQDPDDLIRSGGREAAEALFATPEPLDARLWRHELDAAPLTTPEARAGLRQRLIDHAASIGDPSLSRIYREDWLRRFDDISPRRSYSPQQSSGGRGTFKNGRFVPPRASRGSEARAIAASGIDAPTARALMLGFRQFPRGIAGAVRAARGAPHRRPAHVANA